jgi:hypothetical protein
MQDLAVQFPKTAIVFVGDPMQCPPINDDELWSTKRLTAKLAQSGQYVFRNEFDPKYGDLCQCLYLKRVFRKAAGHDEKNDQFFEVREAARTMVDFDFKQYTWLCEHCTSDGGRGTTAEGPGRHREALHVMCLNEDIDDENLAKVTERASTENPLAMIEAVHAPAGRAPALEKEGASTFGGLPSHVFGCEHAKMTLTNNVETAYGLCNGMMPIQLIGLHYVRPDSYVVKIPRRDYVAMDVDGATGESRAELRAGGVVFRSGTTLEPPEWPRRADGTPSTMCRVQFTPPKPAPPEMPHFAVLSSPQYTGPAIFPDGASGEDRRQWFPLYPMTCPSDHVNSTDQRTQLPLRLCYARSVWKCQGATLARLVAHLCEDSHGGKWAHKDALLYVILTRVCHYLDIEFEPGLPPLDQLKKVCETQRFKDRLAYDERVKARSEETFGQLPVEPIEDLRGPLSEPEFCAWMLSGLPAATSVRRWLPPTDAWRRMVAYAAGAAAAEKTPHYTAEPLPTVRRIVQYCKGVGLTEEEDGRLVDTAYLELVGIERDRLPPPPAPPPPPPPALSVTTDENGDCRAYRMQPGGTGGLARTAGTRQPCCARPIEDVGGAPSVASDLHRFGGGKVGVMVAADGWMPAGALALPDGTELVPDAVHAGHGTQLEDVVSAWLVAAAGEDAAAQGLLFGATIMRRWGKKTVGSAGAKVFPLYSSLRVLLIRAVGLCGFFVVSLFRLFPPSFPMRSFPRRTSRPCSGSTTCTRRNPRCTRAHGPCPKRSCARRSAAASRRGSTGPKAFRAPLCSCPSRTRACPEPRPRGNAPAAARASATFPNTGTRSTSSSASRRPCGQGWTR